MTLLTVIRLYEKKTGLDTFFSWARQVISDTLCNQEKALLNQTIRNNFLFFRGLYVENEYILYYRYPKIKYVCLVIHYKKKTIILEIINQFTAKHELKCFFFPNMVLY